ncbi:Hsp70 family protein [Priestia aryabhattai]|uniref:Chaperone protein DnaK n=1 Tax=Priestia megaterium Q3 TaxID=1452722 RepID=A0A806TDG3_PRIMG|nr:MULTISPECIES: Hsp70 family protein [Priestia]AKP76062.1 Heat shock protein 70 [Priestia megaterium Q3]MBY0076463.1 Hsp70 family protein [Priestia aryabhattai]
MTIIGIDLGTTNSAISYLKNGNPVIIENDRGERTTPSVFQIAHNGEEQVGTIAKQGYSTYPRETVLEVKRLMGTEQKVTVAGKEYKPEEISARLLKYLKDSAEKFLGSSVTEAVITVPAYFSDSQRKATKIAGELAGLKVERIINEPTAAAIAFGIDNMSKDQHILVYDLGGGTFDVSVVELFSGVLEVKASAGNNTLGGMDFDNLLVDWLIDKYKSEHNVDLLEIGTDLEKLQRKARMKAEAENVKKTLSTQSMGRFNLPFIAFLNNAPVSIEYEITRSEFERIIKKLATLTLEQVDKALKDAQLNTSDIDEVLLVGGSTRIPFIEELVQKKFNKTPRKDINPDEAVALGAAVQGGIKSGEIDSSKGLMVIDVMPYTLGVEVNKVVGNQLMSGFFDPIILRNSTVPITESKIYTTSVDYQEEVHMGVYQGDDEDQHVNPKLRVSKDSIIIPDVPSAPAGSEQIEVQFSYDINGMLNIEATVLSTGKKIHQVMKAQPGVMSTEEVTLAKERIEQEWNQSELYKEVKNIINRAEKMKEEVGAHEQNQIEQLLIKLKESLSLNDISRVKKYEDELTDLLIELV